MSDSIDTRQELARTADETQSNTNSDNTNELGPKSPRWRATFNAQLTKAVMDDVVAYVAKRASWIEHQAGRRAPGLIREMVQDAIGDTFTGVVTWDPKRCSLAFHLKTVIRSRLAHELERAEAYNHVSTDVLSEEALSEAMAAVAPPASKPELVEYVDELAVQLRAEAGDDRHVLALIDCYCDGITERRDVCRATRMTARAYHNAHRRLKRLVENLPEPLRRAALELAA
jgi:hypothetical protein